MSETNATSAAVVSDGTSEPSTASRQRPMPWKRVIALTACAAIGGFAIFVALRGLAKNEKPIADTQDGTTRPATDAQGNPKAQPVAATDGTSGAGVARDITFDDLKFNMTKEDAFEQSMLTPKIEKLVGTRIRIRGYIRPSFQQSGITQFILVRDNMECCFGPGDYLYDCMLVEMQPGLSTDFTVRPVSVEGMFSVKEFLDPSRQHGAIYHLSGEKVK